MLALLVAGGSLLLGLAIMFKGRIPLDSEKVVEGPPVYYVGFLLALPLPLIFAAGFVLGLIWEAQGKVPNDEEIHQIGRILEIVILGVCVSLALLVALKAGAPPGGSPEEEPDWPLRDDRPSQSDKDDPYRGRYE